MSTLNTSGKKIKNVHKNVASPLLPLYRLYFRWIIQSLLTILIVSISLKLN